MKYYIYYISVLGYFLLKRQNNFISIIRFRFTYPFICRPPFFARYYLGVFLYQFQYQIFLLKVKAFIK